MEHGTYHYNEAEPWRSRLLHLFDNIRTSANSGRVALRLISGDSTYLIRGSFSPEHSIKVFNDAIEQACSDGFTGFRAAADMSWALGLSDGPSQLIIYEALLGSLFSNCNAVGLCLYDRHRMPLDVLDGALATHPQVRSARGFHKNDFYEPARMQLTTADKNCVLEKLQTLDLAI